MVLQIRNVFSCAFCGNLTTAPFIDDDVDIGESKEFVCKLKADENGNYDTDSIVNLNNYCGEHCPKKLN